MVESYLRIVSAVAFESRLDFIRNVLGWVVGFMETEVTS
jgi:hypothetical protein